MGRIQKVQKIHTIKNLSFLGSIVFTFILSIALSGCTTYKAVKPDTKKVALIPVKKDIPEPLLLDVRIQIFDPGKLPSSKNASRGLSEEIRKAEAHFIPTELKKAMQQTGHWGAVRVIPAESSGDEVKVFGKIIKSNGEELVLDINAVDARGVQWFKNKTYKSAVSENMYKDSADNRVEVFQNIYHRIANDLASYSMKLTPQEVREIRQVAEMRFAEELAPSVFKNYLQKDERRGRAQLERLPSKNDEMLARVQRLRERNYMLVDTLDMHYEGLHRNMGEVYTDWRKSRLVEMNMIRKVDERKNRQRRNGGLIMGLGVLTAVLLEGQNTIPSSAAAPIIATTTAAGVTIILDAEKITEEAEINKAALEELGASFAADVEPTVVKVEGETIKLTGSAQEKYAQWREVMGELYKVETEADIADAELSPGPGTSEAPIVSNQMNESEHCKEGSPTAYLCKANK